MSGRRGGGRGGYGGGYGGGRRHGGGRGRGRGRGGGGGGGHRGGGGRGRGAYYKAKYGRKRSAEAASPGTGAGGSAPSKPRRTLPSSALRDQLRRLEGKQYPAYRDITGTVYAFGDGPSAPAVSGAPAPHGRGAGAAFNLVVDHVQGDAFAPPSRVHVTVPAAAAGFPAALVSTKVRRIAVADFINRVFYLKAKNLGADQRTQGGGWRGAKGGELLIDQPNQHVLERTSVSVTSAGVQARFTVALPARGRTICGEWAARIFTETVPTLVRAACVFASLRADALRRHVLSVEDQEYARSALDAAGLIAFVRNGAILPRASGADDAPMNARTAVPFKSPPELEVALTLPNAGRVTGMGVKPGVTLIVGGGFHGKSTLLKALEVGVYAHIPGDGREIVVTSPSAVKIRAEDGRSIASVDIHPFISNLPGGRATHDFSTPDASGSTSQAANILEALEVGSKLLLIDEDTAATNFMIRDKRMQMLVAKEQEPITPFIARVRELHERHGVIGGAGSYFEVADCVVQMDSYLAHDVTTRAAEIVAMTKATPATVNVDETKLEEFAGATPRCPHGSAVPSGQKVFARTIGTINFGDLELDLGAVEQLVHLSQTRFIAQALGYLRSKMTGAASLSDVLDAFEAQIDAHGLDVVNPTWFHGGYARPRRFELACAVNRLRGMKATLASRLETNSGVPAGAGAGRGRR